MLLPKLYKISILYNFDELNDPSGRRAPVPAFTTFLTKSLTNATTCVKMVTAERTKNSLPQKSMVVNPSVVSCSYFFANWSASAYSIVTASSEWFNNRCTRFMSWCAW